MPLDDYIIGRVIGKGSYGDVRIAEHTVDKKQYVIKELNLQNASEKEQIYSNQEVDILSKLRHPNIVSYKESFQSEENRLSIVMTYCHGGDLYSRLKAQREKGTFLEESQIIEWLVQIGMALQYIHVRNILHRDLKTQNIFLTKSQIVKLGDFGIARVLENNVDMATTMIGTPYYMSPELFSNKPYNCKSDVWALGCCVYEMMTLKHAFNGKDMNSLVYRILKGKLPTMPSHYSDESKELVRTMLSNSPANRPTAACMLRHPFVKKHISMFLERTTKRKTVETSPRTDFRSNSRCPEGGRSLMPSQPVLKRSPREERRERLSKINNSNLPLPVLAKSEESEEPQKQCVPNMVARRKRRERKQKLEEGMKLSSRSDSVDGAKTSCDVVPSPEVNYLIHSLQGALQLESSVVDNYVASPVRQGSNCLNGRLQERIERLRRECLSHVDEDKLKKVYQAIDNNPEDKAEMAIVLHLGRDVYDILGEKILQLKFCEEFQNT